LRKIIKLVAENISKTNEYTKDQEEQIEYAMKILIFEALKVIGVLGILTLFGYPIQAVAAILSMTLSKPFIGGYHETNQVTCFIATLIIIGCIVFLSVTINLSIAAKILLNLVALYCIWQQAPVVNPKMQITRSELITRNRRLGMTIVVILIIISIAFSKNINISNSITWTILFQALLMFNKRNV
jgi:accessory gene regulator B